MDKDKQVDLGNTAQPDDAHDSFSASTNQWNTPEPVHHPSTQIETAAETKSEAQSEAEKRKAWVTSKRVQIPILLITCLFTGPYANHLIGQRLTDKNIWNGSYNYSFKFYDKTTESTIEGSNSLKYDYNSAVVLAKPTEEDSLVENCGDIDEGWTLAFTTQVNGAERPICATTANGIRAFATNFSALDTVHLFSVSYNESARDAKKISSDEKVKAIFNSVKVTK